MLEDDDKLDEGQLQKLRMQAFEHFASKKKVNVNALPKAYPNLANPKVSNQVIVDKIRRNKKGVRLRMGKSQTQKFLEPTVDPSQHERPESTKSGGTQVTIPT